MILSFKPRGTKIRINNNLLYIQEVGYFQSIVRYFCKSKKNDLQFLYMPIKISSIHFLKNTYNGINGIDKIFELAIKGLENLTETYKSDQIICHMLKSYTHIIQCCLNGKEFNDYEDNYANLYYEGDLMQN